MIQLTKLGYEGISSIKHGAVNNHDYGGDIVWVWKKKKTRAQSSFVLKGREVALEGLSTIYGEDVYFPHLCIILSKKQRLDWVWSQKLAKIVTLRYSQILISYLQQDDHPKWWIKSFGASTTNKLTNTTKKWPTEGLCNFSWQQQLMLHDKSDPNPLIIIGIRWFVK